MFNGDLVEELIKKYKKLNSRLNAVDAADKALGGYQDFYDPAYAERSILGLQHLCRCRRRHDVVADGSGGAGEELCR